LGGRAPRPPTAGSRDAYTAKLLDKAFLSLRQGGGTAVAALPEVAKSKVMGVKGRSADELPPVPGQKPASPANVATAAAGATADDSTIKPTLAAAAAEGDSNGVAPPTKPSLDGSMPASMATLVATAQQGGEVVVSSGRWIIQVGAYSRLSPAQDIALDAKKRVPDLLANGRIVIDERANGDGKLYRARIAGLTEPAARAACRKLKKTPNGCLVLSPTTEVSVASH
jgi:D-alanyl-D-alanine carboxypeptidase